MLGRAYTRAEDDPDARVVVFTYDTWQRYFNGDPEDHRPAGAARAQSLHRHRGYAARVPVSGQHAKSEYLMPVQPLVASNAVENSWRAHFFRVIGRLQPGITPGAGGAEAAAIAARLEKQYPEHQHGPQRHGRFVSSGSDRRCASGVARGPGGGFLRSAHRLRQRGQPALRSGDGAPAGDRDPHRARRQHGSGSSGNCSLKVCSWHC